MKFKTDEEIREESYQKYLKKTYIEGILRILNKKSSKELEKIYEVIKEKGN